MRIGVVGQPTMSEPRRDTFKVVCALTNPSFARRGGGSLLKILCTHPFVIIGFRDTPHPPPWVSRASLMGQTWGPKTSKGLV